MASSRFHTIFFDAGNTLVFPRLEDLAKDLTEQGYPATVADFYAAERAGKEKLDAWLAPLISSGQVPRMVDLVYWGEYLRTLVERIGPPEAERERLIERVANGFRDVEFWSRVQAVTTAFLERLRAEGYYLGVISNSVGTIESQLMRLDLARYFDTIIDSFIVGVEKPHPEIFQIALERAKAKGSETIFVGDTYATDVGGARLSGLYGVLIDRAGAYAHCVETLDCPRITSLPDLTRILEGW